MNVNKKFDRLKQWGKERMGGEAKTDTTTDFKALEVEMQLRHDGMERLKKSADIYIRSVSKRDKFEDREQQLPVGYFGSTMINHGDDFEPDSEFGQCLAMLGRANERIARTQETYCANATSSWLESLERSLVQMKEYQAARKRLESRRLAYDTASSKMQKSKREDFRMEEELRSQKMKYEESSEDVYRRMLDIKEAEIDSVNDLTSFLEAELAYYDRCREVLLQLKREWPASTPPTRGSGTSSPVNGFGRRDSRSRASSSTTTATTNAADRFNRIAEDEGLEPPMRPVINSRTSSPRRELPGFDLPVRPALSARSTSSSSYAFEGPTTTLRERASSSNIGRLAARAPTEPLPRHQQQQNLRIPQIRGDGDRDAYGSEDQHSNVSSPSDTTHSSSSHYAEHHAAVAAAAAGLRRPSWTSTGAQNGGSDLGSGMGGGGTMRKAAPPPPPPPSRSKKPPPPPPPPLKRSALSSNQVPQY